MNNVDKKLYDILQKNINQNDYSVFLTEACEQYQLTKNTAYLQLIETFLLKYSTVDRFVTYCYMYRDTNNILANKLLIEHLNIIKPVLENILMREDYCYCLHSNGNLLFMYLYFFWTDDKSKELLIHGAHTLREYKHRFLFSKIINNNSKLIFIECFLENFEKYNHSIDSILILFALYLDSDDFIRGKLYLVLLKKITDIYTNSSKLSYDYEVSKMMLDQLMLNSPQKCAMNFCDDQKLAKKRVAILISGQLRTITESVINLCNELKNEPLFDTAIFIATWEDQGRSLFRHVEMRGIDELGKESIKKSLNQHYITDSIFEKNYMPSDRNSFDKDYLNGLMSYNDIDLASNVISQRLESNQHRMFHRIQKSYEMSQLTGGYDVYVRVRPDLSFEKNFSIVDIVREIKDNELYVNNIPLLASQGVRIDDNFAIASKQAMEIYANTLDLIPLTKGANSYTSQPIIAHRSLAYILLANQIKILNTLKFSKWKFEAPSISVTAKQLLDHALSIPDEKKIPGFHDIYIYELKKQISS